VIKIHSNSQENLLRLVLGTCHRETVTRFRTKLFSFVRKKLPVRNLRGQFWLKLGKWYIYQAPMYCLWHKSGHWWTPKPPSTCTLASCICQLPMISQGSSMPSVKERSTEGL
jgi:hypothetical protein